MPSSARKSPAQLDRLRTVLHSLTDYKEKAMFGGIAFMVGGNMCCGFVGEKLMLRLGKDGAKDALNEPHTAPMDFTGKPLSTMVYVLPQGIATDSELTSWVKRAAEYAHTLPPK